MADRQDAGRDRRGPEHTPGWRSEDPSTPEPPEDPLRRELRASFDLSERQWRHAVSLAVAAPYPFFVGAYFVFGVPEVLFLSVTLLYSLVAMYVGYRL